MHSDANPTAKALRALELLQLRPQVSAADLARELDVSERAARRYVATLREAGIPVESERGPYGGYRLGRGVRLPPLVFTAAEALGLVMAVLEGEHDAGSDDVVGTAVGKLVRALPAAVAAQAETLRRHARPSVDASAPRPDPTTVTALVSAVAGDRQVEIGYRSQHGDEWTGVVDPWAVVVRYSRWYLLCRSHRSDAVRTYRIDRVQAVRELTTRFDRPDGLDPVAALEAHLGQGWEHPTRVRFAAGLPAVRPWVARHLGSLAADGDDACVLTGSTSNPASYLESLVGVPHPFTIEQGDELRRAAEALVARLQGAVASA